MIYMCFKNGREVQQCKKSPNILALLWVTNAKVNTPEHVYILLAQHKKASNHHANHTPGNVQFYIVTTWETPGNHWCWWPDTLIFCPSASEGDNQSVGSSAPVVSRCFPGGYNVKLYISRGMVSTVVTGFFTQCCLRHHVYCSNDMD